MYIEKIEYLNDIQAGENKIKEWFKAGFISEIHLNIGCSTDHLSNILVGVNKKITLEYLKKLNTKYSEIRDYDWVDWVDSRLSLKLSNTGLCFLSHNFEVERIEWDDDNNSGSEEE